MRSKIKIFRNIKLTKTIILIWIFSLTFSSCYSYKSIDNNKLEKGKYYKITDANNTISKIKFIEAKQDSLVVLKNGKQVTVADSDIKNPKERKFSWLKSGGLYFGVTLVAGAIIVFGFLLNGFQHAGTIQSPP
jgi:hypothetical protein